MPRLMKALLLVVGASGVLLAALIGNYLFAQRFILRLNNPADPIAEIPKHMAAVARPLVLAAGGHGQDEAIRRRFSDAVGFHGESLPETADALVDISYVAKVNPNPQPLAVLSGGPVSYLSYGYVGTDDRYHQVTHYWGESDGTPSVLVRSVRGGQTGWGDYFVRYTVHLSRDLKARPGVIDATGIVVRWEPPAPYPDIDRIDWSTYAGGSSDGFEELGFAVFSAAAQIGALGALLWWRWRSRLSDVPDSRVPRSVPS